MEGQRVASPHCSPQNGSIHCCSSLSHASESTVYINRLSRGVLQTKAQRWASWTSDFMRVTEEDSGKDSRGQELRKVTQHYVRVGGGTSPPDIQGLHYTWGTC